MKDTSFLQLLTMVMAMSLVPGCDARDLSDVTGVIKTFERPKCLRRLLKSIDAHLPTLKVVVVDDSQDAQKQKRMAEEDGLLKLAGGVEYVATAHDIGIAAGRNKGLSKVTTKYALMLDDDFVATAETNVNRLVAQVASGEAAFAGGELYVLPQDMTMGIVEGLQGKEKRRVVVSGAMTLQVDHRKQLLISQVKTVDTKAKACVEAKHISNFFLGETGTLRALGWDEELKLSEAEDFFLRAGKRQLKIQYCPMVKAMHDGGCTVLPGHDHEAYKAKRERGLHFFNTMFTKHGIQQYSSAFGGLYMRTCAFGKHCKVAHMWKNDELKTCDLDGECDTHKIAIKKHPGTQNMRMFKCDAGGKKCDVPVMN